jgi:hypothetical protein
MINVIAVDSLRTVPITAKLGLTLISYYLFAAIAFFIPVALVAAELATAYPRNGGIYIWIKEAFGQRTGFAAIWLQWIYNLIWFPTILLFIASTCAYLFDNHLTDNKQFLFFTVTGLFWLFTGLNCFGLRIASMISTLGAIFGTLLPMAGIITMAAIWLINGHAPVNDFHQSIIPSFKTLHPFAMFIVVIFGLVGIEMSAIHAEDVAHPKKDYPKAIAYSAIIIVLSLVLSALAILVVVPIAKLSLVTGLINAYELFFSAYHLEWLTPILAGLIVLGGLSGVSAWMIGPIKALSIAAHASDIPKGIYKLNRFNAPYKMLILQAFIFSLISLCFVYIPSVNAAYWWLSDACSQLALVVYIMMFAAFIKLRYTQPERERVYKVPGKQFGMWLVAGTGILCCLFAFFVGFISPSQIPSAAKQLSIGMMVGMISLLIIIPFWLGTKHSKKHH